MAGFSPGVILTEPCRSAPFSIAIEGDSTLPRTFPERCTSTAVFARMSPFTSPTTTTVPQVISASIRACSPTTSTSFVTIEPLKSASIRTVPRNVSLPSNSAPAPRSRSLVPPGPGIPLAPWLGVAGTSSRLIMDMLGSSWVRAATHHLQPGEGGHSRSAGEVPAWTSPNEEPPVRDR